MKGRKTIMAQKEVRNNVTINTANKEDKKMKKDYTLNGTINAKTWQEFRVAMKEVGINTGTKTYEQLVEEYNALPKCEVVPVGDMSQDKYYPEEQKEAQVSEEVKVEVKHVKPDVIDIDNMPEGLKDALRRELNNRKNKRDARGKIEIKEIYKAIYACFDTHGLMPESTIKGYINALVKLGYLKFKRFYDGYLQFFVVDTVIEK
jgi:nicotinate-nucleotide pyrophosphorylase